MGKVIEEFRVGQYLVLKLDAIPKKIYHKFQIGEAVLEPVPVYDMPQCIAVQSEKSFMGETVEFI